MNNIKWYNNLCLVFLEKAMKFTVLEENKSKGILGHVLIILIPLAMLIWSLMTVNQIGVFLFLYHFISLSYKLIIACFDQSNYKKRLEKAGHSLDSGAPSPYSKKRNVLIFAFGFISFLFMLSFIKAENISLAVCFSIAIYLNIFVNFLQDIYSGIVSLYGAFFEI